MLILPCRSGFQLSLNEKQPEIILRCFRIGMTTSLLPVAKSVPELSEVILSFVSVPIATISLLVVLLDIFLSSI